MECCQNRIITPTLHPSIPPSLQCSYSYLSAVTGSRREADHAGAKPEISPVNTDTSMLTSTSSDEKWIGKDGKATPTRKHIKKAKVSPIIPPSRQSAVDSIKN